MTPDEEYAIEIHCENSFLKQLNKKMKKHLYETIDIENALSFYSVLQSPVQGGELMLFDKDWDDFKVEAGNLSGEARKNPAIFFG